MPKFGSSIFIRYQIDAITLISIIAFQDELYL